MTDRIVVDVPAAESSRDRVETAVFARLDAIRAAERAAALSADRPGVRPWMYLAAAAAAAVAVTLVIAVRREPSSRSDPATAPSLVVTPVGGSSRFTVDDAVIDAGSDTEVEVRAADPGEVTFVLARGTIDCDVAPRKGRPLRVRAGDVVVEVVGTRFSVARTPGVRVDVTHGQVRVRTPGGEFLVGPGERWSEGGAATATAGSPGAAVRGPAEIAAPPSAGSAAIAAAVASNSDEGAAQPAKPPVVRSSREAFQAAQRLEPHDRRAAARAYRAVASGDGAWAALALYSLAELDASSGLPRDALAAVDEYLRRFPRGAGIEDVMWVRVETLRALGRQEDARGAAASYLRQFPRGTYEKPATRVAAPP
jgi:transmembrane sensor